MAKNFVIIYKSNDWNRKIPISKISTRKAFQDWHERGEKSNVEFFRASIDWFDENKGVFTRAWVYRNKKWLKIRKPIKPDLIYDKVSGKYDYSLFDQKMKLNAKAKVFNHPLFKTILNNKLAQQLVLEDFLPKTFFATCKKDFAKILEKITTEKIVIKPIYGVGGKGIIIGEKKKLLNKKIDFPVLVQSFIKTNGIPGISEKNEIADLRIIYLNHQPTISLSRIAKGKSLMTNFSLGAKGKLIPLEKIPKKCLALSKKITKKLSLFPEAQYSLDFMFTEKGNPILMEMNPTPGFDLIDILGDEKLKQKNFEDIISILE